MFKPLGLFVSAPCPDPACKRARCFFGHAPESSRAGPSKGEKQPVNGSETPGQGRSKAGTKRMAGNEMTESPLKRARATAEASGQSRTGGAVAASANGNSPASLRNAPSTGAATPRSAPPPRPVPAAPPQQNGCPSLPLYKTSAQPRADRQKALQTLYTQFLKLYTRIPSSASLASKSAVDQEADVSSTSPGMDAYKRAIHHAAVSISRRSFPDSSTHPSVGTVKESRIATETAEKEAASKLTPARIAQWCHPLPELIAWGYPDPSNPALVDPPELEPDAEGTTQTCNRCKATFVVSSADRAGRLGECKYHYGRIAPERIEGKRKWIYSCCKRERGEVGCEDGIHVFSEKEDDEKLARRVAFQTTDGVLEETKWMEKGLAAFVDVVGMDCEMIYTTAGTSLGRVTIIDESGNVLLDELIRQTVPILDANTRFSGLTEPELQTAVMDLPAARAAATMFIGPETIIVGHGLENDLRALRLLHTNVIDTALVFPHDKGRPYRRALRDIVKEKLGYFIQDRTADLGHSSAEDAKAALEVLKWKVREDA